MNNNNIIIINLSEIELNQGELQKIIKLQEKSEKNKKRTFTQERKRQEYQKRKEKNIEQIREKRREYYQKNKEKIKAQQRSYNEKNKEKIKEYQKKYFKKKQRNKYEKDLIKHAKDTQVKINEHKEELLVIHFQ